MDKVLSAKVTRRDYFNVKSICRELRMNLSTFIRNAVYHEIERIKNLSKEEKMELIKDSVQWNCSTYDMNQYGKPGKY